jgi:hypothetical protein
MAATGWSHFTPSAWITPCPSRGTTTRPKFPYNRAQASAVFAIRIQDQKLIQRAKRMFDFIERYPKLFRENVRTPELREQFIRDIPDLAAAEGRIKEALDGNSEFIAFAQQLSILAFQ